MNGNLRFDPIFDNLVVAKFVSLRHQLLVLWSLVSK